MWLPAAVAGVPFVVGRRQPGSVAAAVGTGSAVVIEALGLGLASAVVVAAAAVGVRTVVECRQLIRMTFDHWGHALIRVVPVHLVVDVVLDRPIAAFDAPGSLKCPRMGEDLGLRIRKLRPGV